MLDKADSYLINKIINKMGVPTSSLTGILGKIGGGAVGAIGFVLSNPTTLGDPYLGKDGQWYTPDGKLAKKPQCRL